MTYPNVSFLADAINSALGTDVKPTFFQEIGRETLALEREFNIAAGFTAEDDDLPQFFYDEALKPTGQTARFRGADLDGRYENMSDIGAAGVPAEFAK